MKDTILSLQHFADEVADLNATTSQGLSAEMKTFYDKTLIEYATPALVHDQFAQKRDIPAGGGSSIEFRRWEPLSTNLEDLILTENIIPDGQECTVMAITATIGDFGGYVKLSDKLELTAVDRTVVEATRKIAEQAAVVADKITREKIMEGTNVIYAGGGTARHALTGENTVKLADVFRAAAQLKQANAPTIDGSYVAVIHPYTAYELMQETGASGTWMDVSKYSHTTQIFNGELGKLGGVRFVESSQAKIWRGEDLSPTARTLTATAASGGNVTVSGAVAGALVGRYVILGGELYYVSANTATQLTLKDPDDHTKAAAPTVSGSVTVYPGEGGAQGCSVYATVVCGAGAYATTGVGGDGLSHIMHDKSRIGGPLDQYSTVGWKLRKTAEILADEYLVRIESCSAAFPHAEAN